ncbi:Uncharacterised protein [Serratia fonticola]|uniref:Fumarase D n=1 Tax=Serratia fonticola TaxID=47917 RepID=A0A3S4XAZ5_SERFO|nr:Uncharacterised protein [Serratia fonticola]
MEKAHEAMCQVIGESVVQICSEKRVITNESIIEMIEMLSEGQEVDLAVEFALDMLR